MIKLKKILTLWTIIGIMLTPIIAIAQPEDVVIYTWNISNKTNAKATLLAGLYPSFIKGINYTLNNKKITSDTPPTLLTKDNNYQLIGRCDTAVLGDCSDPSITGATIHTAIYDKANDQCRITTFFVSNSDEYGRHSKTTNLTITSSTSNPALITINTGNTYRSQTAISSGQCST